jgi:hypothetical protein
MLSLDKLCGEKVSPAKTTTASDVHGNEIHESEHDGPEM